MALAAGERLGPVCSLNDQSQVQIYNQPFASAAQAAGMPLDRAAASVPLQAGSQQQTAQATIVYALRK
jgi:uncharacterized protein YggE